MTDVRNCYTAKGIASRTDISVQHIHRLTKNNTLKFEPHEYEMKDGNIAIYSESALEKFIEYSKTNHRGRKKKEETENAEE